MLKKIYETTRYLQNRVTNNPRVGIILGTGLGALTDEMEIHQSIAYTGIPHFPVSSVEGHDGQLIFGNLGGVEVMAMRGRLHYYEGHSMERITFPVRIMKQMGINLLVISNASGGVNPAYEIGDLMFITDHINLMGDNPLKGENIDALGPRFVDLSEVYDKDLTSIAVAIAERHNIRHHSGVFAAVSGPTFETPAEYRYIRMIGADAVGMSTIPEAIVAKHMHMRCFAISVISDLGVEGKIVEITHRDVIDAASKAEPAMTIIIKELISQFE